MEREFFKLGERWMKNVTREIMLRLNYCEQLEYVSLVRIMRGIPFIPQIRKIVITRIVYKYYYYFDSNKFHCGKKNKRKNISFFI